MSNGSKEMRQAILLFGWPPVATAFVLFGLALFTARSWPAFAGAVIAAPFCLFVTRYPLFYLAGHLALVANFASAYLVHRGRRDVAFAALLPLMLISAVLVVFAIRHITLLPASPGRWGAPF